MIEMNFSEPSAWVIALFCGLIVFLPGCSQPTPQQITAVISAATPVATQKLLSKVATKSNAKTVQAVATNLSAFIKSDILPWLNGTPIPATDCVNLLESKLLTKINDPAYETGIAVIIGTLTANLNLTAPTMNANEQAYAVALATGIAQGCDIFAAGKVAHFDGKAANPTEQERLVNYMAPEGRDGACNKCKAEVINEDRVYVDADGKQHAIVGRNPKGADFMLINGIEYGKSTDEYVPDILVDEHPYCRIGQRRVTKSEAACVSCGRAGGQ
jgi:Ni,Fe-hydrogenase III small subunit